MSSYQTSSYRTYRIQTVQLPNVQLQNVQDTQRPGHKASSFCKFKNLFKKPCYIKMNSEKKYKLIYKD
jgi:hypothetical protein